ncbi:MAG: hypothetical protein R3214_10720 [Christiangramia sp.]|nr:hypothetical protein [Christiangramia sp.]
MKTGLYYLIILLCGIACKSPQYLPKPMELKNYTKGLILEMEVSKDSTLIAEIIEVGPEHMMLLPVNQTSPGVIHIERNKIPKADIIISLTSDDPGKISKWSGLVSILSIGHGYIAIFSLPINIAAAVSLSQDAAKGTYRTNYPENVPWEQLHKFARFPQGIPKTLDPMVIR